MVSYFWGQSRAYVTDLSSAVLQQTLTINLSNYDKENKQTHLYENYVDLSQGDATVDVINAPRNRQFFVVQAHSLEANVTISKTAAFARNSSLSGTHVGLVEMDMQNSSYRYFVRHQETPHVKILVALVVYERNGKTKSWPTRKRILIEET